MNNKLSDKDKKDWQNFILNKDKIYNKDIILKKDKINKDIVRKIDLHGFSLDDANNAIEKFIIKSFGENVSRIVVITGKGLRSQSKDNPYVSEKLSILRYSVPEFIKSRTNLMKKINKIYEANIEDGGQGAFYIYLKNS